MKEIHVKKWTDLYSEQIEVRLEKRKKLEEMGLNPYRNDLRPSIKSSEIKAKYDHLTKEEIGGTEMYAIAARVLVVRSFGKAAFLQIDDGSTRFQIYIDKSVIKPECFEEFKLVDYGDIVWAKGDIFKTNKGELSLNAHEFHILTKSIRPLPEKFHGLTDSELRYRMRYVDMIMNPESRDTLRTRSEIIRYIREFFYDREYLEVETPMMHSVAGGAAAKPFKTHHNTLDMELSMRIAPELYLKRLLVGGFPRVFEMNRNFRNEGVSHKHNPEFTSIEFYQAYADFNDMVKISEDLLGGLARDVLKSETVTYGDNVISFKTPFARMSMKEAVLRHTHLGQSGINNPELMKKILLEKGIEPVALVDASIAKLQVLCFEEFVEEKLIQPTFITEYPTEISPLSRRNDEHPEVVDRFELFVNGWEIANAFSELNNPTDQLDRFADQAVLKEKGDDEACETDYDFVRALEYGMPPTAGQGIGIDRLVMLMTNSTTIRDVIAFPLLKKEHFFQNQDGADKE